MHSTVGGWVANVETHCAVVRGKQKVLTALSHPHPETVTDEKEGRGRKNLGKKKKKKSTGPIDDGEMEPTVELERKKKTGLLRAVKGEKEMLHHLVGSAEKKN